MPAVPDPITHIEAGTPAYRRANLAMFIGGFTTFALLYGPQPILPVLSSEFSLTPARASLSVSAATATLALMLVPASLLSDRYGRTALMKCSLFGSALLCLLLPLAQHFDQLLLLRALLGAAAAGLPAAAMAWIGEEIVAGARGRAMGLYIAGNAFGGMSGRFLAALLTDWGSWQIAFLTLGLLGMLAALLFWKSVPASRHFQPHSIAPRELLASTASLFRDPGLIRLFLASFLLMGSFIALYNYLGFRLLAQPYGLSQVGVGAIFLMYALGTVASAWSGRLVDQIGRRNVLWMTVVATGLGLALTLAQPLAIIIAGVALFTFGFFGAHATASGWVGERARTRRALAAALYLTSYYLGASVIGSLAGFGWAWGQWTGVALMLSGCMLAAILLALQLRRVPPISQG